MLTTEGHFPWLIAAVWPINVHSHISTIINELGQPQLWYANHSLLTRVGWTLVTAVTCDTVGWTFVTTVTCDTSWTLTAVLFIFVWLTMMFLSISIKWFVAHHTQPYGLLLVMKNLTSSFFKEIHSSFFVCPVLCWCSEKIKTIVRCKRFVKNVMNRITKDIQYQWNCKISPNIKFLFSADVNPGSYTDRTMTERISTQCVHVCSTWSCTTLYMHTDM